MVGGLKKEAKGGKEKIGSDFDRPLEGLFIFSSFFGLLFAL